MQIVVGHNFSAWVRENWVDLPVAKNIMNTFGWDKIHDKGDVSIDSAFRDVMNILTPPNTCSSTQLLLRYIMSATFQMNVAKVCESTNGNKRTFDIHFRGIINSSAEVLLSVVRLSLGNRITCFPEINAKVISLILYRPCDSDPQVLWVNGQVPQPERIQVG